jgi:hypothetical protein
MLHGSSVDIAEIRTARRQAIAALALLGVIAGVVIAVQKRPANGDELKIPIATLRSHAGELALLDQRREHLPTPFAAAYRKQLSEAVDSAEKDLDNLKLQSATLETLRDAARRSSADLAEAAEPDTRDARSRHLSSQLLTSQQQLKSLESRLER